MAREEGRRVLLDHKVLVSEYRVNEGLPFWARLMRASKPLRRQNTDIFKVTARALVISDFLMTGAQPRPAIGCLGFHQPAADQRSDPDRYTRCRFGC
jgi:hypothetical protein